MAVMLVYATVAALGLLFLAVTLLVGEIAEVFDTDSGDGVGPFNGKVLAVALTGFGSAGLLATYFGASVLTSALIAGANALLFGAAAWWLVAFFYRQQATTSFSLAELRGRTAEVSVPIPSDGLGYIVVRDVTGSRHVLARSRSGAAIPAGRAVRIVSVVGTTALVEPEEGHRATEQPLGGSP